MTTPRKPRLKAVLALTLLWPALAVLSVHASVPVCEEPAVQTDPESGLPILQSNPGAPIALYLDFDGGVYHSSSRGDLEFSGFNRSVSEGSDGDPATFDSMEQTDIRSSLKQTYEYFAMFDVNVVTDPVARDAATAWAWILVTEDVGGGKASVGRSAIGQLPYARAYVTASRIRIESTNRSRSVASELGHNFTLRHQGEYENGEFIKLSRWSGFDGVRGAIMGSGEGIVNGWRYGSHDGKNGDTEIQDDIEIIRQRIVELAGPEYRGDGMRPDDHGDSPDNGPGEFCLGESSLLATGVIERMDDQDLFAFDWAGGDLSVRGVAAGVSALNPLVRIFDEDYGLIAAADSEDIQVDAMLLPEFPAGRYFVEVSSQGGYGELGAYELQVGEPPSEPAIPAGGYRVEMVIANYKDDAEEKATGYVSRSSSDLEMVQEDTTQVVGLRFSGPRIPRSAIVHRAYIQFQADETDTLPTTLTIAGEMGGSAVPFSSATNDITNRTLSSQTVSWSPGPWLAVGEAGQDQRTPDLSQIVQEIIDQPNWVPGNAVAMIIQGTGKRVAESFDGKPEGAAKLVIDYVPVEEPESDEGHGVEDGDGAGMGEVLTQSVTVSASKDDAEERVDGDMSRSSSDLELTEDGGQPQVIGLRFLGIEVPAGAVITEAHIQLQADETSAVNTSLTLAGELAANPAYFSSDAFDITSRPLTESSVSWMLPPWSVVGERGPDQKTPDLRAVIQEVIDQPDWQPGNAMAFIISGSGKRVAVSFNGNPEAAAELTIHYQVSETP